MKKKIKDFTIEEKRVKLNHFSNFQPLCSYINRDVKKDKK